MTLPIRVTASPSQDKSFTPKLPKVYAKSLQISPQCFPSSLKLFLNSKYSNLKLFLFSSKLPQRHTKFNFSLTLLPIYLSLLVSQQFHVAMATTSVAKVLLVDLSGTLHVGNQATRGAVEALDWVRTRGVAVKFLTNTTKESKRDIYDRLVKIGKCYFDYDAPTHGCVPPFSPNHI